MNSSRPYSIILCNNYSLANIKGNKVNSAYWIWINGAVGGSIEPERKRGREENVTRLSSPLMILQTWQCKMTSKQSKFPSRDCLRFVLKWDCNQGVLVQNCQYRHHSPSATSVLVVPCKRIYNQKSDAGISSTFVQLLILIRSSGQETCLFATH